MTITLPAQAKSGSVSGSRPQRALTRTMLALVGALMAVGLVTSCGSSEAAQANAYINALNEIGTEQNLLANLPAGSPELKTAIATAVPKMQAALTKMQAAEANLTGEALTVAQGATPEAQKMVTSLDAAAAALAAGDETTAATQLATFDEAATALQGYVQQWNEKVATQN